MYWLHCVHLNGVSEAQKDREVAQMARADEERRAEEEKNVAESRAHAEWVRQLDPTARAAHLDSCWASVEAHEAAIAALMAGRWQLELLKRNPGHFKEQADHAHAVRELERQMVGIEAARHRAEQDCVILNVPLELPHVRAPQTESDRKGGCKGKSGSGGEGGGKGKSGSGGKGGGKGGKYQQRYLKAAELGLVVEPTGPMTSVGNCYMSALSPPGVDYGRDLSARPGAMTCHKGLYYHQAQATEMRELQRLQQQEQGYVARVNQWNHKLMQSQRIDALVDPRVRLGLN